MPLVLKPKGPATKLAPRKRLFVDEWLKDFHLANAYLRAGYNPGSKESTNSSAWSLMREPLVAKYKEERLQQLADEAGAKVHEVLRELVSIALVDPADMLGMDGKLLSLQEMPERVRRAISSVEMTPLGPKYKMHDKLKALEMLGKYRRMWDKKGGDEDGRLQVSIEIVRAIAEAKAPALQAQSVTDAVFKELGEGEIQPLPDDEELESLLE